MNVENTKGKAKYNISGASVKAALLFLVAAALAFGIIKTVSECTKEGSLADKYSDKSIINSGSTINNSTVNEVFGDYTEISKNLSLLQATNTEWTNVDKNPEEKGFNCIAVEDEGTRMVYNLDPDNLCGLGYRLSDFDYLWVDSVNTGFYCVINIPGETVDLSGYYILVRDSTGNLASRLIINCYEAKAVKLNDTIVTGTLIAPYANVEYGNTVVYGEILAKGTTGQRAYYKEISFGGLETLLAESMKVSFSNGLVRKKAYQWLKTNYPEVYGNYKSDYVLSQEDCLLVTELDFSGEVISKFYNDLDNFKNLKTLILSNTKVKELDLSELGKLEVLDVSRSELVSLTLPEKSFIRELRADNTKLESLDTACLTRCEILSYKETALNSQPDFAMLTAIKELNICETGFTGFTETEAKAMAKLESLDISENPEVKNINTLYWTEITSLNVRNCGLSKLDISSNTKLESLNISFNSLTDLDFSGCAALTTLTAYGDYKEIKVGKNTEVLKLSTTKTVIKG